MNKYNLNKSSIFLLPIYDMRPATSGLAFYNAFLSDGENVNYSKLYVVFQKENNHPNAININNFNNHIIDVIEMGKWIVYTINIPESRRDDVKKFINGKYSKLSIEYKNKLIYIYNALSRGSSKLYSMLFPTKENRQSLSLSLGVNIDDDAEIYSCPYVSEETINMVRILEDYLKNSAKIPNNSNSVINGNNSNVTGT